LTQLSEIPDKFPAVMHATSVSLHGVGLLICGPSGSGKTMLAFQLMALGGQLISDDLTELTPQGPEVLLSRPSQVHGPLMIEARGMEPISVLGAGPTRLGLVIDLGETETERLPTPKYIEFSGKLIRCFHNVENPAYPSMLLHYVQQTNAG